MDLFQNDEFRKRPAADHASEPFEFIRNEYPVSEGAAANTVWLVHAALLGSEQDTREIVEAVKKVQQHAGELAATY